MSLKDKLLIINANENNFIKVKRCLRRTILGRPANIDFSLSDGITALHFSIYNRNDEMTAFLLDNGASVQTRAKMPLSTMLDAIKSSGVVKIIADLTPLHVASFCNSPKMIVEKILGQDADVNAIDSTGKTPIHWAAMRASKDILEMLTQMVEDIDVEDNLGCTPLHYASYRGKSENVELLLSRGALINKKSMEGATALHLAVDNEWDDKYQEVIEILIKSGINIEEKSNIGDTALHVAAKRNNYWAVKLLLENGANKRAKNVDLQTPFDCASNVYQIEENSYGAIVYNRSLRNRADLIKELLKENNINRE